jgi:hypothetical protein
MDSPKGYDAREFARGLRALNITPHIVRRKNGKSIDGRTTWHNGYAISQSERKRVEEISGWAKKSRPDTKGEDAWKGEGQLALHDVHRDLQFGPDEEYGGSSMRESATRYHRSGITSPGSPYVQASP